MNLPSFEEYLASLSQLGALADPTVPTAESEAIRAIVTDLEGLVAIDRESLAQFVAAYPDSIPVLGLAAGLTREKLKNALKHHLRSGGWVTLARQQPLALIAMLDEQYDIVRLLEAQRGRSYDFGDILVARAGTRTTAAAAGATGRRVEEDIERVARDLGLELATRTRFEGRNGATAPCDLAIPAGGAAARIVVAAKGFDSTGSKLSDAVREIEEMADKRLPTQYVMAAVDGIGWKSRLRDLRRIHDLRSANQIDGLYTLRALGQFRADLEAAARRLGLL